MAESSPATANSTVKKVQPEGMDKEACLLAQLAEVPLVNRAWVQPSQRNGALITVSDLSCPFHSMPLKVNVQLVLKPIAT